jgi:hypothetical protein
MGLVNLSVLISHVVVGGLFPAGHLSLRMMLVLFALRLSAWFILRLFNTNFVEWTTMGLKWARWIKPVEEAGQEQGQSVQHSGELVNLISHEEDKCSTLGEGGSICLYCLAMWVVSGFFPANYLRSTLIKMCSALSLFACPP